MLSTCNQMCQPYRTSYLMAMESFTFPVVGGRVYVQVVVTLQYRHVLCSYDVSYRIYRKYVYPICMVTY